jgi:hypothetical protein
VRLARIILFVLSFVALEVGVWAAFFPRSFYDDFPGANRIWVSPDGPYNEHLVRDVGELNLALAAVTFIAAVTLSVWVVRAAALAWILYSLPHLVYHLRHLEPFDTADQVGQIVSLSLPVLAGALVLWLSRAPEPSMPRK